MDQDEINQAEWADSANWTWGVYNSPRDTRVWVPKQLKWTGWTVNFAHTAAYVWLFVLILPAIVIAVASIWLTAGG